MVILYAVILLNSFLLLTIPLSSLHAAFKNKRRQIIQKSIRQSLEIGSNETLIRGKHFQSKSFLLSLIEELLTVQSRIQLPSSVQASILEILSSNPFKKKLERMLHSRHSWTRKRGILLSTILPADDQKELLMTTILHERQHHLRLRMAALLLRKGQRMPQNQQAEIIEKIRIAFADSQVFFQKRILSMLHWRADSTAAWVLQNESRSLDPWEMLISLQAVPALPTEISKKILQHAFSSKSNHLIDTAIEYTEKWLPELFQDPELQQHDSAQVRSAAAASMASTIPIHKYNKWLMLLKNQETRQAVVKKIQARILPQHLPVLIDMYAQQSRQQLELRRPLAALLHPFLEQLLQHGIPQQSQANLSATLNAKLLEALVSDCIAQDLNSSFITYLNEKADTATLVRWKDRFTDLRSFYPRFDEDCRLYIHAAVYRKMGASPEVQKYQRIQKALSHKERGLLATIITASLAFPVILYFGISLQSISLLTFLQFFLAAFFAAANGMYLLLTLASALHIRKQKQNQRLNENYLLFLPGMLPKISVLVPAYNEEKTIVDNLRSLLALRYPDFEVIVINDGSSDFTTQQIIRTFNMSSTPTPQNNTLRTAPVYGTYKSTDYPDLFLIDKANGGKADSLNAGINLARGEYICSIDADSLLEQDALLHMMKSLLDSDTETAAIGGNVFPINGCSVKEGTIQRYDLPRRTLPLLQSMEYLRSFINGRLGWARTNALLIISGAFGIFRRDRVLEINGYLTSEGRMHRETVGEDMELVVRLRRHLYEKGIQHRVDYQHAANCWTEVPDRMKNLLAQRDRWQRGLAEILLFHRHMLAHPRFRSIGLFAFPFFYIFELIGPVWNTAAYFVLASSIALGMLPLEMLAFIFAVSTGLAITTSLLSFLLTNKEVLHYPARSVLRALVAIITSNFGYQQITTTHRAWSSIRFIFRQAGWRKFARTGFSSQV